MQGMQLRMHWQEPATEADVGTNAQEGLQKDRQDSRSWRV